MTTPNDRQRQAFEAFKKAWEEYPSQDNEGFIPDRGGFKCGWFAALQWADSTPPLQEGDEEAYDIWRTGPSGCHFRSRDTLNAFVAGLAHARRAQNAEVERLKNDVKRYSEMSLQYMSQIQELRSLLERAMKYVKNCGDAHEIRNSDFDTSVKLLSDYKKLMGKKES